MGTVILAAIYEIFRIFAVLCVGIVVYRFSKAYRVLLAVISSCLLLAFFVRSSIFGLAFIENLCTNNAGGRIHKKVNADNYLFVKDELGIINIDFVLQDIVGKHFRFIEVDLKRRVPVHHLIDVEKLPRDRVVRAKAIKGYDAMDYSNKNPGYLKIFRGEIVRGQCRSDDFGFGKIVKLQKRYLNHPGSQLTKEGFEKLELPENKCVGVAWVPISESKYVVRSFSKFIYPGIEERGFRVEDKMNSEIYGGVFAYKQHTRSFFMTLLEQKNEKKCNKLPRDSFGIHREIFSRVKSVYQFTEKDSLTRR